MSGKSEDRHSVDVLKECIELQIRKGRDYQNPKSRITQSMHYPRGCATILDMVHQKITRIYSVMEAAEVGGDPNFESLEDSAKDMINYSSFVVAYLRNGIDGQDGSKDFLGRRKKSETNDG